jgi:putative DNA primase/helicase
MQHSQNRLLSTTLRKVASVKDCATGNWNIEFEIIQPDGKSGRVPVPGEDAEAVGALVRRLRQKGALLPKNAAARDALIKSVIASKPETISHKVARTGWQLRKTEFWFCYGNHMVGVPTAGIGYSPPSAIVTSRASRFAKKGTLEDWSRRVAEKGKWSTCLTLAISAALAAPLLRASGLQNFALHIFGASRAGKSTALMVAMSVYGLAREDDLPNWNSSSARRLEEATAFGDILFPMNEVGANKGKKTAAYEQIRDLYAQYAEGVDRQRHTSWQTAKNGEAVRFRGICISTAEHSVLDYAALAGETRDHGELFRGIDVSAVRKGHQTILDRAPKTLAQRKILEALRLACGECHGTAFDPYLEYLIDTGAVGLKHRVVTLTKEFLDHVRASGLDGVQQQIAKNFALIYAGGALGIEAGVLPWERPQLLASITLSLADALTLQTTADPLKQGLDILRKALRERIVDRTSSSNFGRAMHAGYRDRSGGSISIVVHTPAFGSWFTNKAERNAVLGWLATKGLLKRSSAGAGAPLTPKDLHGVGRRWPDGTYVKSFEFADPFPPTLSRALSTDESNKRPQNGAPMSTSVKRSAIRRHQDFPPILGADF